MMKKIIALALALSMALSMVAFAGYTDAAQINTDLTADIELVGALGLMTGNPDGSFNPTGTLTRAEAAVIIYRLHSGKSTIDASWADANLSNFSDMNHWSVAYVNYCAALGLISGYTDGTFRPENPVSAVEMAKMLLNVAGYDTEKQGYGKNWPSAVLADALNASLYDGYEAAFTGTATREWVAKMVSNMVTKTQKVSYAYGELNYGAIYGDFKFNWSTAEGVLVETNAAKVDGTKAKADKLSKLDNGTELTFAASEALLGHSVKVYYKGTSLDKDAKVYAVVDTALKTATSTLDKVSYKYNKTSEKYELTVDGTVVYSDKKEFAVNVNTLYTAESYVLAAAKNSTEEIALVQNADKSWTAFINPVEYAKVEKADAEKYTFQAGSINVSAKDDYAKVTFVDTVKVGNYVAIETLANGTKSVSKVNAKTVKVASVTGETFTVGTETYKLGLYTVSGFDYAAFLTAVKADETTKATFDVYTDGKYVVYAEVTPDAGTDTTTPDALSSDIMYMIDKAAEQSTVDQWGNKVVTATAKVQVMLTNGSVAIYEYKQAEVKKVKQGVAFDAIADATVYEYVMNDDGTIYFSEVADSEDAKKAGIDTTTLTLTNGNDDVTKNYVTGDAKYFLDENTYFFYALQNDKKTVYGVVKASELVKNEDGNYANYALSFGAYGISTKTGLNTLAYAVLTSTADVKGKLPAAASKTVVGDYFFLLKTAELVQVKGEDGKWVDTYKATGINAQGKSETLTLNANPGAANTMYVINVKDGKTTLVALDKDNTWTEGKIIASTGSAVLLAGKDTLVDIYADAVITYVTKNDKGAYVLTEGPSAVGFNADAEVFYKADKKGNITHLFIVVDKDNKIVANNDLAGFVVA